MTVRLTADRSAAVDQTYYWRAMDTCPLSTKVQLLSPGGVAIYGLYDGKSKTWLGWAPLPKVPAEWKEKQ